MQGLPPEYYRDYDFIHSEKDYGSEAAAVLKIATSAINKKPRHLLEIGCGTGNHTEKFAAQSIKVAAVDTDPEMIRRAQEKNVPNAQFVHGKVNDILDGNFDMASALFNVVSYIDNSDTLFELFSDVRNRLTSGGIFIFDCWNGDVVRTDPPANVIRKIEQSHQNWLNVEATGNLLESGQFANIDYKMSGVRSGLHTAYEYSLKSRLWSIETVENTLKASGFSSIKAISWMQPNKPAESGAWKIMLTACA